MTFQAYLDTINAKTGKSPEDFKALAADKGLVEYRPILSWLKSEFGLGQGHANAMAHVILETFEAKSKSTLNEQVATFFAGGKAPWRKPFDALIETVNRFGPDILSGSPIKCLGKAQLTWCMCQAWSRIWSSPGKTLPT